MNEQELRESIRLTVRDEIKAHANGQGRVDEAFGLVVGAGLLAAAGAGYYRVIQRNIEKAMRDISENKSIEEQFEKSLPQFRQKFDRLLRLFKMSKTLENVLSLEKESEKMIATLERAKRDSKKINITRDDIMAGTDSGVVKWMFRNREVNEQEATRAAQEGFIKLIDDLIGQLRGGVDAAMNQAEQHASGGI